MRTLSEAEIAEEAGFIETYQLWPLWPVLPVKHIHRGAEGHPEDEQVGLMVADQGPKVYLKNLLDLSHGVPIIEQLRETRVLEFESFRDLVRAGWIGD